MTPAQQNSHQIAEMERPFTVATLYGPQVDWVRMVDTDTALFRRYIALRQFERWNKKNPNA